jgi:hypothetical protein
MDSPSHLAGRLPAWREQRLRAPLPAGHADSAEPRAPALERLRALAIAGVGTAHAMSASSQSVIARRRACSSSTTGLREPVGGPS